MTMQTIEKYRLAVDLGRSGGTDLHKSSQYVAWSDGQFECRILPRNSGQIVPRNNCDFTFLYLMQSGTAIKLGMSKNPKKRLLDLKTGAAKKINLLQQHRIPKEGARTIESKCHRVLWDFRSAGEWFEVRPLIAEIAIEHVAFGRMDRHAIDTIIALEKMRTLPDRAERHADKEFQLEMALRCNPTVETGMLHRIMPRIML